MSQLTLPRSVGAGPAWLARLARLGRALRSALRITAHVAWAVVRRTALALARLLGWLAAEPDRTRAALGGLVLCIALGTMLGLSVGLAVARAGTYALDSIVAHQR
jgi:hypothetical protein